MPGAPPPAPTCVLRGHATEVTAARFGKPDGSGQPLLFSGAADGEVRVWSLRTHRPVASIAAHAGTSVLALHTLGGDRLLSQGRDGFVRVWDVRDGLHGPPLLELPAQSYNFCGCALTPSAAAATAWEDNSGGEGGASPHVLALPSMDAQLVLLWDLREKAPRPPQLSAVPEQQQQQQQPPPLAGGAKGAGMCMSLRFVGEHALLSGWEDGSLRLFDTRHAPGGAPRSVRALHAEPVLCLDASADGGAAVSGAADCLVAVTPLRSTKGGGAAEGGGGAAEGGGSAAESGQPSELGTPLCRLEVPTTGDAEHGGIQAVCVRPDAKLLATGGWDRRVRLWQWGKWKALAVLRHHTGTVNAVHFSHCSRWLASASNDRTVAIWTLFPPS